MNPEKTKTFLLMLGAENIQMHKRAGWIISTCPLAPWTHEHGESGPEVFGVKKESGNAFCSCFACDFHGKQDDLVLKMRFLNKQQELVVANFGAALMMVEEAEASSELDLDFPDIEEQFAINLQGGLHEFPAWWFDSFPPWSEVKFARDYLAARAVPAQIADALDLRVDTAERRVCFPIRDFDGVLRGLHGRAVDSDADLRYRMYKQAGRTNPGVWLGEHYVDLSRPIVVVEGPFDVTAVMQVYRNVVSPLFVNPSVEKLKRMGDAVEWVTFYDNGTGGEQGRAKVDKAIGNTHLVTHLKPPKGLKDPGSMTPDQLAQILCKVVSLDPLLD
jgi:hypothetical protein